MFGLALIGLAAVSVFALFDLVDDGQETGSDESTDVPDDSEQPFKPEPDDDLAPPNDCSPGDEPNDDHGCEGSNNYVGTAGSDVIYATSSAVLENGGQRVFGLDGNDRIYSARGAFINGGDGDDSLFFRDELYSASGVTAVGGSGSDMFIADFTETGDGNTLNTIVDFNPAEDTIGVALYNSENFNTLDGTTTALDHTINAVTATTIGTDTFLKITVNQSLTCSLDKTVIEERTMELTKSFLLKGVTYFDTTSVVISTNANDFSSSASNGN